MNQEDELTRTAEVSVIGAILIDEKALPNISEKLVINDFYHEDLKEIYGVILDLSGNGKPIDFLTVLNEFPNERKNEMKKLLLFVPILLPVSAMPFITLKSCINRQCQEKSKNIWWILYRM